MIRNPFNDFIVITPQETGGYICSFRSEKKMIAHCERVINGTTKKDTRPVLSPLPSASEVLDGHRNNYAWRLMAQMRESNIGVSDAIEIGTEMLSKMPGSEKSKTVGHLIHIARSIYRNRPMAFRMRGYSMNASQIIGFDDAFEALKIKSGKIKGGECGMWSDVKMTNQKPNPIFNQSNTGNLALNLNEKTESKYSFKPKTFLKIVKSDDSISSQIDQILNVEPTHYRSLVKDSKNARYAQKPKKSSKSNLQKFDTLLKRLKPTAYRTFENKGRRLEILTDQYQRDLQRKINEVFLAPAINSFAHDCSFAYIPRRSYAEFKEMERKLLELHGNAIKIDIQKFFDNIDHDILRKKLSAVIHAGPAEKICEALFAEKIIDGIKIERKRGIPQGSSFSCSLANLYLTNFDYWLSERGVAFIRYADDIMIFGKEMSELEKVLGEISFQLELLGLWINEEKTKRITC
jgi:hypothetical protein